ncbi:hypothetical protein OKW38_000155 [Paraburkholderia sp. MM5496-R1]|uniref:hypothetical protein n=1 Tax=unclassified Paraburkholderia TaxID=2615204 RepID=UPI003D1E4D87
METSKEPQYDARLLRHLARLVTVAGSNKATMRRQTARFADHGDWKAQDAKVCSKGSKIPYACNEVRIKGDDLYLKRDSGEIVQFIEAY